MSRIAFDARRTKEDDTLSSNRSLFPNFYLDFPLISCSAGWATRKRRRCTPGNLDGQLQQRGRL